ncbi:N-acetylmuramoyl-L-alanine amidase [Halodurantibacterium flavum]|uniref:N-acetylmuramoyl-L-alanine amidase n=1 Tax=Halodurantibacterium flavum TaxID=1382802 RepID=A0ABW4S9A7_9RHOB
MIYQGAARHPVTAIVIHCAATRPAWMDDRPFAEQVAEIRRWHVTDNKWRDIGYHWLIGRGGEIRPGRAETEVGAGVAGYNSGVIHICLIGGHGSSGSDTFSAHFTAAQDVSLRQLIQGISMRTRITRISGHNEHAAKACPGFHIPTWLRQAA